MVKDHKRKISRSRSRTRSLEKSIKKLEQALQERNNDRHVGDKDNRRVTRSPHKTTSRTRGSHSCRNARIRKDSEQGHSMPRTSSSRNKSPLEACSYQQKSPEISIPYHSPGTGSPSSEEDSGSLGETCSQDNEVYTPSNGTHSPYLGASSPLNPHNNKENESPETPAKTDEILDLDLDEDTLKFLGEDPSKNAGNAIQLHTTVMSRWEQILSKGLDKETYSELIEKYPYPSNGGRLKAPLLNAEAALILNEQGIKEDERPILAQNNLGVGLSALGMAIHFLLKEKPSELKNKVIAPLSDAGRILSNVHYGLSLDRRANINNFLSKAAKDIIYNSSVDEYLLGNEFGEKYKNAKVLEKSSNEIKFTQPNTVRKNRSVAIPKKTNNFSLTLSIRL